MTKDEFDLLKVGDKVTNKRDFNGNEIGYNYTVVEKKPDHMVVKLEGFGGEFTIKRSEIEECLNFRKCEKKSPWISVKDSLPEMDEAVLVAYDNEDIYFNHRSSIEEVAKDDDGWCILYDEDAKVKYWMPIPELPD